MKAESNFRVRTENILKEMELVRTLKPQLVFSRDLHVILLSVLKSGISTLPRMILINHFLPIPKCPQPVVKITHSVIIITKIRKTFKVCGQFEFIRGTHDSVQILRLLIFL